MFHTPAHKTQAGQIRPTIQSIAAHCAKNSTRLAVALQVLNEYIAAGVEYPEAEYRTLQAFAPFSVRQCELAQAYDAQ